jgi:hypothetical protein
MHDECERPETAEVRNGPRGSGSVKTVSQTRLGGQEPFPGRYDGDVPSPLTYRRVGNHLSDKGFHGGFLYSPLATGLLCALFVLMRKDELDKP